MEEYQERIKIEMEELTERLRKLNHFIGSETYDMLDNRDQELLVIQFGAMSHYLTILEIRSRSFV